MLEIYWGSGSPFAWRVLLALEIKRIPYASKLIEFSKQQHKAPEFLALNPRGKVPTIRDGDFVLWESLAILAYLDRKVPEPPLFGRTPEDTGRVWRAISEVVSYLEPPGYQIAGPRTPRNWARTTTTWPRSSIRSIPKRSAEISRRESLEFVQC